MPAWDTRVQEAQVQLSNERAITLALDRVGCLDNATQGGGIEAAAERAAERLGRDVWDAELAAAAEDLFDGAGDAIADEADALLDQVYGPRCEMCGERASGMDCVTKQACGMELCYACTREHRFEGCYECRNAWLEDQRWEMADDWWSSRCDRMAT